MTAILIDNLLMDIMVQDVYADLHAKNHKAIEQFLMTWISNAGIKQISKKPVITYFPDAESCYMGQLVIGRERFKIKAIPYGNICIQGRDILRYALESQSS